MSPGLPAVVQPEVVVIHEGRLSVNTAAVQGGDDDEEDTDDELEGAVGGVGISDQQVGPGHS